MYGKFDAFARIQREHGEFVNTVLDTGSSHQSYSLNFIKWNVDGFPGVEEHYPLYSGAAGRPVKVALRPADERDADLERKSGVVLFDEFH